MKVLEKITLIIYSMLMLAISVIVCLLIFGWIDIKFAGEFCKDILVGDLSSKIVLGVSVFFILLSIKTIFFGSRTSGNSSDNMQGIVLENENGKLMISKETLENLVNSTAKQFQNAQEVITKVSLDKENNVRVYATLVVNSNVVIKDLSANLQERIKQRIKQATDLEVKEVNIRVKNIAQQQEQQQDV
ncbi:MAG: alkaline shock response membrane anchor protein AmaP [Clostridia bacterium]|nr:alkaline shock response membrane anchor protein AmaP [Clostridia bacterium]